MHLSLKNYTLRNQRLKNKKPQNPLSFRTPWPQTFPVESSSQKGPFPPEPPTSAFGYAFESYKFHHYFLLKKISVFSLNIENNQIPFSCQEIISSFEKKSLSSLRIIFFFLAIYTVGNIYTLPQHRPNRPNRPNRPRNSPAIGFGSIQCIGYKYQHVMVCYQAGSAHNQTINTLKTQRHREYASIYTACIIFHIPQPIESIGYKIIWINQ